jgi:hypothetical protein
MNEFQQALAIAKQTYGDDVSIVRKPRNGFTSTNPIPSFLGQINTKNGSAYAWWVYRA